MAKNVAQPGPSGWRNSHLVAVAAVQGGVAAMARRGELWQRGQLAPGTVRLWTAACVSPVDCGERPLEPHERTDAPRRRKLRPIACAGCPLKLVEGAAIDAVMSEAAPAFGPAQMGCGAADGAGVMVSLLRTWAEEEMVAHDELPQDPLVFAGLDLENAYGRAYRSACVRGLRGRAPTLAPLAATQWSCAAVTAWQRADVAWRSSETTRGGWQGSRLMQLSFCCGLEEGLEAAVPFAHSDAATGDGACGPADTGRGGGGGGCSGGGDAERDGGKGDAENDGGAGDAEHDGDLGDAGAPDLGGTCWAGRSPPVGPRQGGTEVAGGPTRRERAGWHRPAGRGARRRCGPGGRGRGGARRRLAQRCGRHGDRRPFERRGARRRPGVGRGPRKRFARRRRWRLGGHPDGAGPEATRGTARRLPGRHVVTQASLFLKHFAGLVTCLAAVGHRLRPHKCFAWAPACEGLEEVRRPLRLAAVAALIPVVTGGVTMLGGAVRGDVCIEVDGRADFFKGPAIKRAERAVLLAERIRQFAVAQATPQTSHLAWFFLSKCVCHALSFDARLISSPGLLPVAESVDAAIAAALDDILATKLTPAHRRQLALTGAFGG